MVTKKKKKKKITTRPRGGSRNITRGAVGSGKKKQDAVTKSAQARGKKKFFVGSKDVSKKTFKQAKAGLGFKGGSGEKIGKEAADIIATRKAKDEEILKQRKVDEEKKRLEVKKTTVEAEAPEEVAEVEGEDVTPEDRGAVIGKRFIDGVPTDIHEGDAGADLFLQDAAASREFQLRAQGLKPLDEMAAYQQALLAIATTGGAGGVLGSGVTASTKVAQSTQPGGKFTPVVGDAARAYATNGKSLVKTAGWLMKSGFNLKTAPMLMGAVGSYPFAGFIKEEALQTLSFGVKVAKDSGDLEGEEAALNQIEEVLDPVGWSNILNKIPYANTLKSLRDFYEAARTKTKLDRKSFEKRKGKSL